MRALTSSYAGRKERKRQFRQLWICLLYTSGYLKPLRKVFSDSLVIMALNQADTKEAEEQGKYILKSAGEEQGILTGKMYEESSFDLF